MSTMHCVIVSAEEEIFSGEISELIAPGSIGGLGIRPGHAPLLTGIKPGTVRLFDANGVEDVFFASGGFLEVQPGVVTILADTAVRAEDIDEASAIEAKEAAERAKSEHATEFDAGMATAMLAEALAQLATIEELRKRKR